MADKIGARKDSSFKAVCTAPDFCRTPVGLSTPPLPYMIISNLDESTQVVPNVRFNGKPCFVLDQSIVPTCRGDEPGTAKGIRSGTVRGKTKPTSASSSVRAGGKNIVRERDTCTMNDGNTNGLFLIQSQPGCGIGTDCKPDGNTRPEVKTAPEEKGFLDKLDELYEQTKKEIKEAVKRPAEAIKGAVKDTINTIPELGTMLMQGRIVDNAEQMETTAALLDLFGKNASAEQLRTSADAIRTGSRDVRFPAFEMSNQAQEGGAVISMAASFVTGGMGLLKGGAKLSVKGAAKLGGKSGKTAVKDAAAIAREEKALAGAVNKGDGVKIKRTPAKGAAFGEKMAHQKMEELGYKRIDKGGEYAPGQKGIDGVYKNTNPPPDYVIMESKYNTSQLGYTKDGRQMSDKWVKARLKDAVGKDAAYDIMNSMKNSSTQKWLMTVDEAGNVKGKVLDSSGKIVRGVKPF